MSLNRVIREAFEGYLYLKLNGGRPSSFVCEWIDEEPNNISNSTDDTHYKAADIVNMITSLVTNTYVKNGNKIRKQTKGLPMGTNPAPHLADLHCCDKEFAMMNRLN